MAAGTGSVPASRGQSSTPRESNGERVCRSPNGTGYFALSALIAADSRDFVRAAAFAWITLLPAALSSLATRVLNSFTLSSSFFSEIAARTFRNCALRFVFVARFRMRRTASCRIRFLALLVLGIGDSCLVLVDADRPTHDSMSWQR